jgi:hypothetical protein
MSQGTPRALARLELAGSTAFDRRTDRALVRRRQVAWSLNIWYILFFEPSQWFFY